MMEFLVSLVAIVAIVGIVYLYVKIVFAALKLYTIDDKLKEMKCDIDSIDTNMFETTLQNKEIIRLLNEISQKLDNNQINNS